MANALESTSQNTTHILLVKDATGITGLPDNVAVIPTRGQEPGSIIQQWITQNLVISTLDNDPSFSDEVKAACEKLGVRYTPLADSGIGSRASQDTDHSSAAQTEDSPTVVSSAAQTEDSPSVVSRATQTDDSIVHLLSRIKEEGRILSRTLEQAACMDRDELSVRTEEFLGVITCVLEFLWKTSRIEHHYKRIKAVKLLWGNVRTFISTLSRSTRQIQEDQLSNETMNKCLCRLEAVLFELNPSNNSLELLCRKLQEAKKRLEGERAMEVYTIDCLDDMCSRLDGHVWHQ